MNPKRFQRHNRLFIFISSTSGLKEARDVAENTLLKIEIDASRFEYWSASPNMPISECLKRITESDGMILLLGSNYGSLDKDSGISITHLEYRHAKEIRRPVFAYIINQPHFESRQEQFINEIRNDRQAPYINSLDELAEGIKTSFLEEFTKCFKEVHNYPLHVTPPTTDFKSPSSTKINVPTKPQEAFQLLSRLSEIASDSEIHQIAEDFENKFGYIPKIMNLIYTAEVNWGMAGGDVNTRRIERAIEFWNNLNNQDLQVKATLKYNQGNALGVLQRHQEAIEKYKEALNISSNFSECWKNLGSSYLNIGDTLSAINCFDNAIQLNPLLFEALYCIATLNIKQYGEYNSGLSFFNRIITSNLPASQKSAVLGWKSLCFQKMGRYSEAIAKGEDALAIQQEKYQSWALVGRLYALIRQENSSWLVPAMSFWKRFLNKFPDKAGGWAELGFIYWTLKEQEKTEGYSELAIFTFSKAIELGYEDDGLLWDRIGHLHQENNDWAEAVKAYNHAANKNPSEFGYCLGVALLFQDRYEEALPWLKAAAEKYQPDALSWFQTAICYEKLRMNSEAVTAYQKSISIDPDYPEAWFNLGGLYWNIGKIPQAVAVWKEAIKKFPDHHLCHQAMQLMLN